MTKQASIGGILFFLIVIIAVKTTQHVKTTSSNDLYLQVTECEAINWQSITLPNGQFETQFPCQPVEFEKTVMNEAIEITYYENATKTDDTEYGTAYVDMSSIMELVPPEEDIPVDALLWEVRKEITKELNSSVVLKDIIRIQGQEGRAYTLRLQDGRHSFIRMTMYGSGIYLWSATGKKTSPTRQDQLFLESFTLLDLANHVKPVQISEQLPETNATKQTETHHDEKENDEDETTLPELSEPDQPAANPYRKKRKSLAELLAEREAQRTAEEKALEEKQAQIEERIKDQRQEFIKKQRTLGQ